MKIAAVIIAGGKSTRMGREKAFIEIRGHTVIDRIVRRVTPQCQWLSVNANGNTSRFAGLGLEIFPDTEDLGTPLAGLLAALAYGRRGSANAVLTVPSDTPFLPHDLVERLDRTHSLAAVAASGGEKHYLTGLWRRDALEPLAELIHAKRLFRVKDAVSQLSAAVETWPTEPYDPFFNVNTPADLAEAERIAAEFDP